MILVVNQRTRLHSQSRQVVAFAVFFGELAGLAPGDGSEVLFGHSGFR